MSAEPKAQQALPDDELALLDAYWRAANYLSVGQIYLLDNPLLREPLAAGARQAAAARPLRHDARPEPDLRPPEPRDPAARPDAIYVTGPGHGGPGLVANAYLEGTYSEVYPHIGRDEDGPAGSCSGSSRSRAGSRATSRRRRPGSIHEGGELGYALAHAYGAAFDNPDLLVACVVGDGEAETGPLATSWHSNKFLNPATDGAVLPILHLNGYKIANPTVLARIPEDELDALFEGYGYEPLFVSIGPDDEPRRRAPALRRRRSTRRSTRSPRSSARPATTARPSARAGR